jgi:hypothetical protein
MAAARAVTSATASSSDGVPGCHGRDVGRRADTEDHAQGDQRGRHDQRLRDRRVADGVGIGGRAVRDEVDSRGAREAGELLNHPRELEPWHEHPG